MVNMSKRIKTTGIHKIGVADAVALMHSDQNQGLTDSEVSARQKQYGFNALAEPERESLLVSILRQLANPLALILLGAFALTLFLQEYIDAVVILAAIIINLVISLYQERRAGDAFRALSQSRSHTAVVVRDGHKTVVPAEELVPGDIVELGAGAYVPADGRLLSLQRLAVNQVIFTGESEAVEKEVDLNDTHHVFDRTNMVYLGSTVMAGEGVMVVTDTGTHSQFGKIADQLSSIEKDLSPVQKNMRRVAVWIGVATLLIVAALIVVSVGVGKDFYQTVLLAIAIGVSAVPEGLLSAVTVVLAFGARSIMKQGGLVKNLASAETLGSASYILTDKTGTLTYGKMKTEQWFTLGSPQGERGNDHIISRAAGMAISVFFDAESKKFVGDEMDIALADFVYGDQKTFEDLNQEYPIVDTIPFDSKYKFFAVVRPEGESHTVFLKGAADLVIERAEYVYEGDALRPIGEEDRAYFNQIVAEQSEEGRRLLAVALRQGVGPDVFREAWDEDGHASMGQGLVLCGVVSFYDRVRSTVPEVIHGMRQDEHTQVIMITGDGPGTAHRIGLQSGVITDPKEAVYTGNEIEVATDEELLTIMRSGQARIFARVTPEHKLRLATILQEAGEVVAMTGDGVNDAPALQKATIGISLSSSTEVAKEAADLVLVDDSFDTIAFAIKEGRRLISNLKKTIIYLLSTSFSIVFVIIGSLVVAGPVPFYPTQILWANIIEEGLMNFAFIFEPAERLVRRRKPGQAMVGQHTRNMIIGLGIFNGVVSLGLYLYLTTLGLEDDLLRTYMFAALSIDNIFFGLALKSVYDPIWRVNLFNNMYLLWVTVISFALLALVLTVPILQNILHLQAITWGAFALIIIYGLINLGVVEIVKKVCRPTETTRS